MESPPPPPQQPAAAPASSFFPQVDELQTLAAQMLRSQSTPIPMSSPPTPPPPPPQQPAPGFSFFPQEHELVLEYLRPKLQGSPLPPATKHFFHHADVYAAEPSALASEYPPGPARAFGESKNWYFFCPVKPQIAHDGRKPRIVAGGKGTWKAERAKAVVDPAEGRVVGRRERFTYVPKPKEEGKPPEWLMMEFSLSADQELVGGAAEPAGLVLYKIYQSPRFLKNASKLSSSSSSASARKRKAADELPVASARNAIQATDESTPVRRQLLFPPEPILPAEQVAPNQTAEVDEMVAEYLADNKNWEGYNCTGNPSSAPWSCSMMTAALSSTPFCGGPEFWSSIAAP